MEPIQENKNPDRRDPPTTRGLTADCPIVDWVVEHPRAIRVFERLGIDYHCGGKSLEYACRQRDLSPEEVVAQIVNE